MAPGFDKTAHGLSPVGVENVGGLIFICLGDTPPPIDRVKADIADQIAVYDLEHMKVAVQDDYIEDANWKLVIENNRECYHCDAGHPELIGVLGTYGFGKGLPEDGATDVVDDHAFDAVVEAKRAEWKALGIFRDLIEFPDGWWHRIARLPLANGAVTQSIDGRLVCQKLIGPFTFARKFQPLGLDAAQQLAPFLLRPCRVVLADPGRREQDAAAYQLAGA